MYLRWRLFLSFLILYGLSGFSYSQEYLKDVRPKEIKFDVNQELPPVELPRPLFTHRFGRSDDFEDASAEKGEEVTATQRRRMKSQRPTLVEIALEASVREGLNAMQHVYGVIEPDMLRNGHVLHDDHPAALLSRFSAPVVETSYREMAAYATLTAAKAFRKSASVSQHAPPSNQEADRPAELSLSHSHSDSDGNGRQFPTCDSKSKVRADGISSIGLAGWVSQLHCPKTSSQFSDV